MSPRAAIRAAADVAVFLWSAFVVGACCVALAWMGHRVMLAVLDSGGTEEAATGAWSVFLVPAGAWLVVWAVRWGKKWKVAR